MDDPYRLNVIAQESQKKSALLQKTIFERSSFGIFESDASPLFFVISREMFSGLHFGLLSNIDIAVLSSAISKSDSAAGSVADGEDPLDLFRNRFIGDFGKDGFLRRFITRVRNNDNLLMRAYMIFINPSGVILSHLALDSTGQPCGTATAAVGQLIDSQKHLRGTKFFAQLTALQRATAKPVDTTYCLLVRPERALPADTRRPTLHLLQLGLLLLTNEHQSSYGQLAPHLLTPILRLMDTSSISAYSVLYERERYFTKAMRQSAKGTIVKWGVRTPIEEQIALLDRLNTPPSHVVPVVLVRDNMPKANGDGVSWYEMPKYSIPRLLDLLVSTTGYSKYEIVSLGRACYDHLKRYCWKSIDVRAYAAGAPKMTDVIAVLTVLHYESEAATSKIYKRWIQWESSQPVRNDHTIVVPETSVVDDTNGALKDLLTGKPMRCALQLDPDQKDACGFDVLPPCELLLHTIDQCKRAGPADARDATYPSFARSPNGRLHGDPHFENLFVDASIPEDPFIVAIDPMPTVFDRDKGSFLAAVDKKIHWEESLKDFLEKRITALHEDPITDVAKLLLSTTGLYSLVTAGAFRFESSGAQLKVKWKQSVTSRPLGSELGGVSGGKLIAKAQQVVTDAWRYHVLLSEEFITRYLTDIETAASSDHSASPLPHITLTRLWALLVRAMFSVSHKLYPEHPSRAHIMYIAASILNQKGCETISAWAEGAIDADSLAVRIRNLLSPNVFSNK